MEPLINVGLQRHLSSFASFLRLAVVAYPLLCALCFVMASRMAYIVRRSFYLALDQLKNPRSVEGANQEAARADSNEWNEVEVIGYPYFIHWVKDTFEQFLTANLQVCTIDPPSCVLAPYLSHHVFQKCKEKCFEEFFSTETLYWGYNEYAAPSHVTTCLSVLIVLHVRVIV